MITRRVGGSAIAAWFFGGLFLFVGGYYFLRNNLGFDLGELDGELVWPAVVIVLGALLLLRGFRRLEAGE